MYDESMEESRRTEAEYVAAISAVLAYIQTHLDEQLTPHMLADVACFSQHHFHRIFRAVVGESVMDHVRRLRLERAAYQLKATQESVVSISYDSGYVAQAAFTRIFKAHFGLSPSRFRRGHTTYLLPTACGVHFAPAGFSPLRRPVYPRFLESDDICAAHRNWPEQFEARWEEVLATLTNFASLIHPYRPHPQEIYMNSNASEIDQEIDKLEHDVEAARERLIEARKRRPRELVQDSVLQDADGKDVQLSELFGDKDDLIVIHNMGTGCIYCTMWADGFTGLVPHLTDRAAFVLCTPDKPEVAKRFSEKRNWNFKVVTNQDGEFIRAMGFWQDAGPNPGPWPGASTFKRDADGRIYRIAKTHFGPGDEFCAALPFMDMLEGGANGWEPKYSYTEKPS
jgi:AraC-like DNA-binding protein/predicted dithiol-disulfide oxidoreductase (DUF899 family)